MYLKEFANLSKELTGLDEIIWVDENKTYINGRHYKRLKVYLNNSKSKYLTFSLVSGECLDTSFGFLKKSELPKDMKQITNFILNNQQSLLDLSDGIITLDEFKNNIIVLNESINFSYHLSTLEEEFFEASLSYPWEDIKDSDLYDEMYDVLYILLYDKKNEKELTEILNKSLENYEKTRDIKSSIDMMIDNCVEFTWSILQPHIDSGAALFDDIDVLALSILLSKLILGID